MTKSELIETLSKKYSKTIPLKDIESGVKFIVEYMGDVLSEGKRIEIRGFGSFAVNYRMPRTGRNPKTGVSVALNGKYSAHFKAGKGLRERVDASRNTIPLRPK